MTYDELLQIARRAEGKTLRTVSGKPFTVGVYLDSPYFTPGSTGVGRSDGRKAAERLSNAITRRAAYAQATTRT